MIYGYQDGCYRARLQVALRLDDRQILDDICFRLGVGSVREYHKNRNAAIWTVADKGGCRELVRLFDRFPLRAKKAADYEIWRKAVKWHDENINSNSGKVAHDWTPMADFKAELQDVKRFVRPSVETYA